MPNADNAAHAELRIASEDFTGDCFRISRQFIWHFFSGRDRRATLFERLVQGMGGAVLNSKQGNGRASESHATRSAGRDGSHSSGAAARCQCRQRLFANHSRPGGDCRAVATRAIRFGFEHYDFIAVENCVSRCRFGCCIVVRIFRHTGDGRGQWDSWGARRFEHRKCGRSDVTANRRACRNGTGGKRRCGFDLGWRRSGCQRGGG